MNLKRTAAGLVAASLLICSGCQKNTIPIETPAPTPPPLETPLETPEPAETGEGIYTLRQAVFQQPHCWNPHAWRTEADRFLLDLTTAPLLRICYGSDGQDSPTRYCQWELAEGVEDITGTWTDREAWGIGEAETGRVWRIRLNPNACWDDEARSPITAEDYLASMRLCLSPERQNLRAESWTAGECALLGAAACYYAGGSVWQENAGDGGLEFPFDTWTLGTDGQYRSADGTTLWFSLAQPLQTCLGGSSLSDYYRAGYLPENVYQGLSALANSDGYIPVTEDSMALLYAFTGSDTWGHEKLSDLAGYVFYPTAYPATGWESVGLLKEDEYTLLYITEHSVSEYALLLQLTTPWLVYTPLYEASDYAASPETTVSCGPYRLLSCENGQLLLERNENWCGQTSSADRILLRVLPSYEAARTLFDSGELDILPLESEDYLTYRDTNTVLSLESGYVSRLILVTDRAALLRLQAEAGESSNKTCLSLEAFRTALSLSIDRAALSAATVPGGSAALGLLNRQYELNTNPSTASVYRDTEAGMSAICKGYGVQWGEDSRYTTLEEAYAACSGYDPEQARGLFQSAYEALCVSGDWTEDTVIRLRCAVSGSELSGLQTEQNTLLQGYLNAATAGTGFEGKLTLTYVPMDAPYSAVANGQVELALGAWGGAAFGTYAMLQCWCDPNLNTIQERCGFDPVTETLTLELNGEALTRSYQHWSQSILDGGDMSLDPALRLQVLSELEASLLLRRCCIPLFSLGQAAVLSGKVNPSQTEGSLLYGYGGAEQYTFTCDDAQWASLWN